MTMYLGNFGFIDQESMKPYRKYMGKIIFFLTLQKGNEIYNLK
ncbi:hypothetical protein LEP1GSC079_1297 [Leptospira interrogans str. FPW1039]|uniref:Uncharacterized protein n=8 Tax=Leptospira interrogans TaxID=173 RepID=A0A0F6I8Z5_LEPIR|nr:hypothetical protein LEP1GSC079_1297 [Leptospira interrogans str. FPW1039]EMN69226.1 hypothetical protein LEP1GSC098_1234 [Leptospira interrogans serovar Grippotyphosa str. UI 08434]EMN77226.1 hypothetical protein LEP1GSC102_2905 [Leptospira interrogans str. UI 09600]